MKSWTKAIFDAVWKQNDRALIAAEAKCATMHKPYSFLKIRNSARQAMPPYLQGWASQNKRRAVTLSTQLRLRNVRVGRKEGWKYNDDKSCPCCRTIEGAEEDEYHVFIGECPLTMKRHKDFMKDLDQILHESGIRAGSREIAKDILEPKQRSREIFCTLLADRPDHRFPDRRGSWARAKARFEQHLLDCWAARASMIKDPDSRAAACEAILLDLDKMEEGGELSTERRDALKAETEDMKQVIEEESKRRKNQDDQARKNAKNNTRKAKARGKSKTKTAKKSPTPRIKDKVRNREGKNGFVENVKDEYYIIRWDGAKNSQELKENEFVWIRNEALDDIPDLDLLGIEVLTDGGATAHVIRFDTEAEEFVVHFDEPVYRFWLNYDSGPQKEIWGLREIHIKKLLERAEARSKPGPLAHPDKG